MKNYYKDLYNRDPKILKGKLREFEKLISAHIHNKHKISEQKFDNLKEFREVIEQLNNTDYPSNTHIEDEDGLFDIYENLTLLFPTILSSIDEYIRFYENGKSKTIIKEVILNNGKLEEKVRKNGISLRTGKIDSNGSYKIEMAISENNVGSLEGLCQILNFESDFNIFPLHNNPHSTLESLAKKYLDIYTAIDSYSHNDKIDIKTLEKRLKELKLYTKSILDGHIYFSDVKDEKTGEIISKTDYKIKVSLKEKPEQVREFEYYKFFRFVANYLNKRIHYLNRDVFDRDKLELVKSDEIGEDPFENYMGRVLGNER